MGSLGASKTTAPARFEYKRSEGIKEWSNAEEKRTKEISKFINDKEFAGGWQEYYESNPVEDDIVKETLNGFGNWKDTELTISKANLIYTQNYDENDRRVKKGKAVTGSTYYIVSDDGMVINENYVGYKTLADAKHALQLYKDETEQWRKYRISQKG